MPRRERRYRVVLDAQPPEDLAARCSAVWCELLDVAEHNRVLRRDAREDDGQPQPTANDGATEDRERGAPQ